MVCTKKTATALATAAAQLYSGSGTGATTGTAATASAVAVNNNAAVASSSSTAASASAAATASASASSAANSGIRGFNYGAFFMDYSAKKQSDFEYEFSRAQDLTGTSGWSSARLYTTIQYYTTSDPIEAIPAAIATNTSLLLGLWVSGSDAAITNEIAALQAAISQYGSAFTSLVQGISVGSEDLYRDAAGDASDPGATADQLIAYIAQVRAALAGTALAATPVGHVDTYDSFENGTNTALLAHLDWVGFDGYPYWESANGNAIDNAHALFFDGLDKTRALAGDTPVWVTETGWPAAGDDYGAAVASSDNARTYWQQIACELVDAGVNLWWYDLQESQNGNANPDFGVFGAGDLYAIDQRYDLSC